LQNEIEISHFNPPPQSLILLVIHRPLKHRSWKLCKTGWNKGRKGSSIQWKKNV